MLDVTGAYSRDGTFVMDGETHEGPVAQNLMRRRVAMLVVGGVLALAMFALSGTVLLHSLGDPSEFDRMHGSPPRAFSNPRPRL